jgi:hypothetical protein
VADALLDAIGGDRKREPARERRTARQPELAQPRTRKQPGEDIDDELERVPAADEAEDGTEWPEEKAERPAREVRLRLRLRLERVRIAPGFAQVLELMPDEPVVVERLQMIAGRGFALCRPTARHELGAGMLHCGPRRRDTTCEIERDCERYEGCAARSNSSKSGTSAVS